MMLSILRMFSGMVGRVPLGHLWYLWRRMRNEKPHRFAGQIRINTFFPPYPSESFRRFCQAIIKRRRVPLSVYLAVTNRCPYSCDHCSIAGRDQRELPTADMLDIIAQLKTLGVATLGFTGGEPTLRDDLPELLAAAKPEMTTIVFTTGENLTADLAGRFARAGCDCVTVGIEAATAKPHDEIRGAEGSFATAEAAIRVCQQAGLYTAVSTIGTKQRLAGGEIQRMFDLAAKWKVREFRLLAPVATGGRAGCGDFMLSPEEYRTLADFHVQHNRRRYGPAVACFAYLESPEMFGCGAGYHHLFIDAGGEVCPCDLTPLSFGNVTRRPLAEIWDEMAEKFPRPRCRCIMADLAERISTDQLPLPPARSNTLIQPPPQDAPLPEGYRRLLKQ